jgi:hypothetical protein
MIDQSDLFNSGEINNIAKKAMKAEGLFVNLGGVYDKDTMKWILVKFLKETLDFLSENEEARKIKRGTIIERWIDENLPNLPGQYHNP